VQPLCLGTWGAPEPCGPFPSSRGIQYGTSMEPVEREQRCVFNAGPDALLVPVSCSPRVALGPTACPVMHCGGARAWPPVPAAIAPSLPAREASCLFGRMGEMEKAPPLPWANTAPLSSYPGERNSQVPAGMVTSPPGNVFPRPAGKGALVSLKEPPDFPHPKPFPDVSPLAGAGGCDFGSVGKGCYRCPVPGELAWGASRWGRQAVPTPRLLRGRGTSAVHPTMQLRSFWGPETQIRSTCLALARGESSPKELL